MTGDLRDQLRRLDPMRPGVPTEPVSPTRMERIMSHDTHPTATPAPNRNRWVVLAGGLAVVALVAAIALPGLFGEDTPVAAPVELTLGADDPLASCLRVEAQYMVGMSPAFEGTVTAVEGETVTLSIDRWYAGETEATEAVLTAPAGMEALIGGVDFRVGEAYLITATDGTVNYCGFSGPATPELRSIYEEAFGA